ncbi:MAG: hypothetical protein A3H97_14225 [Acidobacteria bacterium RIFCSPLOWO2_02_FULL_65_29]|nr:MAG: hypothetical protein A3H97_14225 [Acidobacteria bacterium RIFCSPLOWO2_02_FULL_65_29]
MGNLLVRVGNIGEAYQSFREAVRLAPASAEAQYNVGSLAFARGDLLEALGRFQRAARLNPEWATPEAALAWLLATSAPSVR